MPRAGVALRGLAAGLLMAASVPPWGWWPLGIAGAAVLVGGLGRRSWPARLGLGAAAGAALYGPTLWWMHDFSLPGWVVVVGLESLFLALATVLGGLGRRPLLAVPAAFVVADALRSEWPVGGLPLGGIDLGQAAGPLAPAASLGGRLLVGGLVVLAGTALAQTLGRRSPARGRVRAGPAVALALVAVVAGAGRVVPAGRSTGTTRAALAQGGGDRGLRAVFRGDPEAAFLAQTRVSAAIEGPLDLVLWPEDVIDVSQTVSTTPEGAQVAALSTRLGATVVAGVVEDSGADRFRNAAVAWAPGRGIVARYDKVHRVPFGEYVPFRSLVARVGDLSAIPRDALPGGGPGVLDTPAGRLGCVISYEVFFPERARSAVRSGGQVLLVPTNASSFRTSQVPTQELAAARLRALETGRAVLQAAPTGYTAVLDRHGRVLSRSRLGAPAVLQATVERRTGSTVYAALGPGPLIAVALVTLLLGIGKKFEWGMVSFVGRGTR